MAENNFTSLIEANNNTKGGRTRNLKGNSSILSQKSRESFRSHRGAERESQGCFKIFKPKADLSVERSMNKSIQNHSEFDQSAIALDTDKMSVDPSLIR